MNTTILKFLIALIGFVFLCFGYRGLTTGEVIVRWGYKISKEDKLVLYWINVGVYLIAGATGIILGLVLH